VGVLFREVRPLFRCRRCGVKRRGCAAEVDIDSTGSRISSRLCVTKKQDVFCVKSELYRDVLKLVLWIRIRTFVFGPTESGSTIICTDPDSDHSIIKQKSKKTSIFTVL
jgi:hypothetical protein